MGPFRRVDVAQTRAEAIFESLRDSIVSYEVRPGERLTEVKVAREFAASRTPVRESLRRLQQAGLVKKDDRRGWYVREFDLTEMDQLYAVRLALESTAILEFPRRPGAEDLEPLRAACGALRRVANPTEALIADEAFHEAIARGSRNMVLLDFVRAVNQRIHIIRRIDFTDARRIEETIDDHEAITARLSAGQTRQAERLLKQHIIRSKENIQRLAREGLAQVYRPRLELDGRDRQTGEVRRG